MIDDPLVVVEFNDLSVPRSLGAHLLVGGMFDVSSGVSGPCTAHATQILHRRFNAPEASTANHESRHGITGGRRYMGRVQGLIAAVATLRA